MQKHRLIISNSAQTITLPVTKNIVHSGEYEGQEVKMADGTLKYDALGFRLIITYSYTYLPASVMSELHSMLRKGKIFQCTYIDVDNTEKTGDFVLSYPQTTIFMYKNNVPVWKDATLQLKAKVVI